MTDLDEARALLAAITPGEWRHEHTSYVMVDVAGEPKLVADCGDFDSHWSLHNDKEANATFIARAPALVASLMADVERLRALIVEPDARNSTPEPCRLDPHDMCPDDGCAKTGVCLLRYDDPRAEPRHD